MVGGLVSACSSPAWELRGARRQRARLAGSRRPAWCSSSSVSRQICGGGGSGGRNPELVKFFGFFLRRIRRRLRQCGVAGAEGRLPWSFTGRSSVAARRTGYAASFNEEGVPGQWQDGGWRSSSSSPAKLLDLVLALTPLRVVLSSLYVYCVLLVEYTWAFKKKNTVFQPLLNVTP